MTSSETPYARLTRRASELVLDALGLIVLAILLRAIVMLVMDTFNAYLHYEPGVLKEIGLRVLTVFVFVEIFNLFRDYRRNERLSVLNILTLTITIVVREIWIMLFEGTAPWQEQMGVAAVLLVVGALWLAVRRNEMGERAGRRGTAE